MTNQQFVDRLKNGQDMRAPRSIDNVRRALRKIGVKTSAYNSPIDPGSAAWLFYASLFGPTTSDSSEWIIATSEHFAKKYDKGEETPVIFLQLLFGKKDHAENIESLIIDQVTGDLYAFFKKGKEEVFRFDFEKNYEGRKYPLINYHVQVSGDYFRLFHEFRSKLN